MSDPAHDKVRRYRQRLRNQGLRPVQIWVVDTRAPGFPDEARRQSRNANQSPSANDDQAFVDAISVDWGEWDE